ncbi:hypothetical protein H257_11607 [Aphanomyces astaci]|uniref:Uncharacterized protein n=1 Tax=Aphanomyces astaci TaxID=112090 RepID=W4G342_APHAT|nr:hypothetical protein H257_11607 [Aphanomyces astaci]ETV73479.1 hypothetical protein H257_11607 [Aphanomyces astaci]|eukprot:XP_009836905.1 hypothetical protein H257_11607 [Aphanomyces astaci]
MAFFGAASPRGGGDSKFSSSSSSSESESSDSMSTRLVKTLPSVVAPRSKIVSFTLTMDLATSEWRRPRWSSSVTSSDAHLVSWAASTSSKVFDLFEACVDW